MSKTKNFIFQGKQSFSSSKLAQIKDQFNKSNQLDAEFNSNEIYIVLADSDQFNKEGIKDILCAEDSNDQFNFYVGPRLGTISPWSSKTCLLYTSDAADE